MTYLEKHSAFNSRFVAWFLAVPNVVMAVLLVLAFYWAAVAGAVGAVGFVLIITWTMAYRGYWPGRSCEQPWSSRSIRRGRPFRRRTRQGFTAIGRPDGDPRTPASRAQSG